MPARQEGFFFHPSDNNPSLGAPIAGFQFSRQIDQLRIYPWPDAQIVRTHLSKSTVFHTIQATQIVYF
jgi:hypothetical protein